MIFTKKKKKQAKKQSVVSGIYFSGFLQTREPFSVMTMHKMHVLYTKTASNIHVTWIFLMAVFICFYQPLSVFIFSISFICDFLEFGWFSWILVIFLNFCVFGDFLEFWWFCWILVIFLNFDDFLEFWWFCWIFVILVILLNFGNFLEFRWFS